jgi:hypothetical protein
MDHEECSDALFEVTRPIDDILWLNIWRCIYGALIPSRVKQKNSTNLWYAKITAYLHTLDHNIYKGLINSYFLQ